MRLPGLLGIKTFGTCGGGAGGSVGGAPIPMVGMSILARALFISTSNSS